MSKTVELARSKTQTTLTFNRPQHHNAFNDEIARDFLHAVEEVANEDTTGPVLLRGEGPAFMVGGDIRFFHSCLENFSASAKDIFTQLSQAIHKLHTLPRPTVCEVHGSVAGVGMSIMCACDFVLAEEDTKFTTAYLQLALSPDGGLSYLLPRKVGPSKAFELLTFTEPFGAEKAERMGLVNWVVPHSSLEGQRDRLMQSLTRCPPHPFAQIKRLHQASERAELREQMQEETQAFLSCAQEPSFARAIQAFLAQKS